MFVSRGRRPIGITNSAPTSQTVHIGIFNLAAIGANIFNHRYVTFPAATSLGNCTTNRSRTDSPAGQLGVQSPGVSVAPVGRHGNTISHVPSTVTKVIAVAAIG